MLLTRTNRWFLRAAIALAVACLIWVVLSLRDDDSALSVVGREVKRKMGWSADTTTADVLRRMAKYEKKGRYDDAIRTGAAWTEKYPDSGEMYEVISVLCLKQAGKDGQHADEYVNRAIVYRDKALPFAADSPWGLERLAAISEYAGDLSTHQRCTQYRNAIKLLDNTTLLLNEKKVHEAKQFRVEPNDPTPEQIEHWFQRVDTAVSRLKGKLQDPTCR